MTRRIARCFSAVVFCFAALILLGAADPPDKGIEAERRPAGAAAPQRDAARGDASGAAWLVVPLPIEGLVDTRAIQRIDRILKSLPPGGPRPLLVIEFRGDTGRSGQRSQFERSLALARYLTSPELRRVRTVAFVPQGLQGHAVLPALACEQLAIGGEAEFGPAGDDEEGSTDATVIRAYQDIVERRRTFPWPVVQGMLDRDAIVSKVKLADGVRYVLDDERRRLEQEQPVLDISPVKPVGELGRFTGNDLRDKTFASYLAADRAALSAALGLAPRLVEDDPSLEGGWKLLRLEVQGPIHARTIGWIRRSLDEQLKDSPTNLLLVKIDSPGGSLADSLSLASYLAELDPSRIRTVAWVSGEARSDAALIALACDRLVMSPDALLGGTGTAAFEGVEMSEARTSLQQLAERKQIPWSLLAAMIDPEVKLRRYTREGTNQVRLMNDEEHAVLDDRDRWQIGAEVATFRGIRGHDAETAGLTEFVADDLAGIKQHYRLDDDGAVIEPTWAHMFIEGLASPRIAALLLFVAWFALMFEFMTPTLTGAGFVSGVCFLLYFWSAFLHGTAGWLEILLFLAGVAGVVLEVFVFPGVGILGFGGGALILVSIVLASQTFVIPHNRYQLEQLPVSLGVLIAGIAGAGLALALLRHLLPRSPVFSRLMLKQPDRQSLADLRNREAVADYSALLGQRGRAVTRLMPGGKARFGETTVDVVTEGEVVDQNALLEVVEAFGTHVVVRQIG